MTDIAHNTAAFNLEYKMRNCKVNITSDDSYQQYLENVTMLPNDSRNWGFHLVNYFLSALPEILREPMRVSPDFVIPRLSCL